MSNFSLILEYQLEEDGYFGSFKEMDDIICEGETVEELEMNLLTDLYEYAIDYMDSYELYSNSTNRKDHEPMVRAILKAGNPEALKNWVIERNEVVFSEE